MIVDWLDGFNRYFSLRYAWTGPSGRSAAAQGTGATFSEARRDISWQEPTRDTTFRITSPKIFIEPDR